MCPLSYTFVMPYPVIADVDQTALPIYLFALFPLFWIFVGFIISNFGWSHFAEKFKTDKRQESDSFNCPQANFGFLLASYRNVMQISFTEEGIYVYASFLFRLFHPPFLVPWQWVKSLDHRKTLCLKRSILRIQDGDKEINSTLSDSALRCYEEQFKHRKH